MPKRNDMPERRQQLIVDKTFQYSLMRLLAAMWLVNIVVLGGLIYYLYAGPVFRVEHLAGQPDIQSVNSSPPQFGVLLTLGAVLGLAVLAIVGLHLSHQIAGPLAQLKAKLHRVGQGDLSEEMRVRRGDYLADLPDYFNDMLRSLRERSRNEVQTLRAIEADLDESSPVRARLSELLEEKEAHLSPSLPAADDAGAFENSDPSPALES